MRRNEQVQRLTRLCLLAVARAPEGRSRPSRLSSVGARDGRMTPIDGRLCRQKPDRPSRPPALAWEAHWRPLSARLGKLFQVTTVSHPSLFVLETSPRLDSDGEVFKSQKEATLKYCCVPRSDGDRRRHAGAEAGSGGKYRGQVRAPRPLRGRRPRYTRAGYVRRSVL